MSTTDHPARCGWCSTPTPATERVVWQHDPRGCWCEGNVANDRRHVSFACEAHVAQEIADVHEMGSRVLVLTDVTA